MGDQALKIIVIGTSCVGKTSLIERFVCNVFTGRDQITLGLHTASKTVRVDGEDVSISLWDTGGQELHARLTSVFHRGARGAVLVYDITAYDTFERARERYLDLQRHEPSAVVLVVGNKLDLAENREVSVEEGQEFAKELGAMFLETSAATAENVELAFLTLLRIIRGTPPEAAAPTLGAPAQATVLLGRPIAHEEPVSLPPRRRLFSNCFGRGSQ